jgi:SAC3 family protein LENG8/THP3
MVCGTFLRLSRYLKLPLSFIKEELAFEHFGEARDFLMNHSSAFFSNPNSPDSEKTLECKPAAAQLAQVFEEKYRKVSIKGAI